MSNNFQKYIAQEYVVLKLCGQKLFQSLNSCIMPIIHIFWSAEKFPRSGFRVPHGFPTIRVPYDLGDPGFDCGTVERFCQCWDGRETKVIQNVKRGMVFCHRMGDSPAELCADFCKNNCDIDEMNKQMEIFKSENPEMENHFDEVFIHGDIWTNFLTIINIFKIFMNSRFRES